MIDKYVEEFKQWHPEVYKQWTDDLNDWKNEKDFNIEEQIDEIYNSDENYKHCDPTTGQQCFSHEEIALVIEEIYNR